MNQEEAHNEIIETLQDIDGEISDVIERLGGLRNSFPKDDPNYAKVNAWYTKLLTKNPISDIIDDMEGTEADPDGDDAPAEPEVVFSLSKARAKILIKAARHTEEFGHVVGMSDDELAVLPDVVDELELAIS